MKIENLSLAILLGNVAECCSEALVLGQRSVGELPLFVEVKKYKSKHRNGRETPKQQKIRVLVIP